ncbi:PPE family protein [Mycobacterium sp.]|uniref:PPE family protein n=1 Tax=Mycobacterium sp. TaxID=1785 RepID=UPI003F9A4199
MDFLVLRPEVNSSRMFSGTGSGSMLAAARAWDGLAAELESAATSFGSVVSGVTSGPWQGPSAAAMRAAAAPYVAWLTAATSRAEQSATQIRAAAGAFEAAFAATVHPAVVAANRAQLVSLVRSNLLGLNAPAIAAIEADYEQMWAQDVAAMVGYHGAVSAAVGQLMPWQQAAQTVSTQALGSVGSLGSLDAYTGTRITVAPAYIFENQPLIAPLLNLPSYSVLSSGVGENWFPATTPEVVNYPATAGLLSGFFKPTADQSMAIGQKALNTDILNATSNGQSVVVAGESMGSMVIDREEAYLFTQSNAPSPNQVTFVEFSNPERGLADTYLPAGIHVPLLGYTVENPPVTPYNTTIVYHQYEGFADPPDRPWNLLADANAVMGVNHYHLYTEFTSQTQVVEVGSPVTNLAGGTTTTYMVPATILPLLLPLQTFGVPAPIIDHLNSVLTPMVNEGYSQYDPGGGAYVSHGKLVWPS